MMSSYTRACSFLVSHYRPCSHRQVMARMVTGKEDMDDANKITKHIDWSRDQWMAERVEKERQEEEIHDHRRDRSVLDEARGPEQISAQ